MRPRTTRQEPQHRQVTNTADVFLNALVWLLTGLVVWEGIRFLVLLGNLNT